MQWTYVAVPGLYLGQNLGGVGRIEGRVGLMGRLGSPRGWVREEDVPAGLYADKSLSCRPFIP